MLRVVVLCGGKGTRLEGLDLPKPLCTIRGKSVLFHVLSTLPEEINDVTIFYNSHLDNVQFQRHVLHTCPRNITFVRISADTRGPVETAYVCLRNTEFSPDDKILFLDNDSINEFSLSNIQYDAMCLGVFSTSHSYAPYSFVNILGNQVTEIREKERISNTYCTGLYYFPSVRQFLHIADRLFEVPKREYFMSDMYRYSIDNGDTVVPFHCKNNIPLGTLQDIHMNIDRVRMYPMRICFDIDNTIFTNSVAKGTRDGIEPIPEMVSLLRRLHSEGNTIILATARSMETCNSNTGAANKRGALDVLTRLEHYGIPYDEIYFGKPWAHVYVDDRAWNQYTNPTFGKTFFGHTPPLSRGSSNNQNTLFRFGDRLLKKGTGLQGEIYFYNTCKLPVFPICYDTTDTSLTIQYIPSQTASQLFRNGLLRKDMLKRIVSEIRTLHNEPSHDGHVPTPDMVFDNMIGNLRTHYSKNPSIYDSLPNFQTVLAYIEERLVKYTNSEELKIVNVIHGDPWFENILFTSSDDLYMIDMRGKVGSMLTVKGDPYLDYAKVYQSILGFDYALYGEVYNPIYESKIVQWMKELEIPLHSEALQLITACCILKSLFYISDASKIESVYHLIWKLPVLQIYG